MPTALLTLLLSPLFAALICPFRRPHAPVIPRLQRACPEPVERGTQRPDRSQRTPPPRQPPQPERASPPNPSQPQPSSPTRPKIRPSYLSPARTPSGGSGWREIAPPLHPRVSSRGPPRACPELVEGRNLAFLPCSPTPPRGPESHPALAAPPLVLQAAAALAPSPGWGEGSSAHPAWRSAKVSPGGEGWSLPQPAPDAIRG